ncbi:substrate-binding domain-containing protein [Nocardioides sp.]|uniref:substrate-binding domain-containing protein n=1 Tax=Nocardioides sp. TaxID=35761 RepID=UPI0037840793
MTTFPRRTRLVGSLAAAAVSLALLSACSDPSQQATDTVDQGQAENFQQEQARLKDIDRAYAQLPTRPSGVVDIDGSTAGSLTQREVNVYETTANAAEVNIANNGEDQAFQELCAGRVDLVDSARPISRAEWDACQAVGLDVVQFQVAAEAVVVAIKSESDVGADCLTVDQVRDIWRAGSPLTNWSQAPLGYDNVPLRVGGPGPASDGFSFFGRYVLDAPEPARVDLRSDYYLADSDEAARMFVVGTPAQARLAATYDDVSRTRAQAYQALQDARQELQAANQELKTALYERKKGIRDQRSAKDKAKDQARVDAAYKRQSKAVVRYNAARVDYVKANRAFLLVNKARARYNGYRGHVAYFRYSYYELFEDQLRPFEITDSRNPENCIFPSQRTITDGEYPLARQLLITTTTRSLARPEVRDFMTHYLRSAQQLAADNRLVALSNDVVALEEKWLSGELDPELYAPEVQATPSATPLPSENPAK